MECPHLFYFCPHTDTSTQLHNVSMIHLRVFKALIIDALAHAYTLTYTQGNIASYHLVILYGVYASTLHTLMSADLQISACLLHVLCRIVSISIMHYASPLVRPLSHHQLLPLRFLVTDIGNENIVLGYPWLPQLHLRPLILSTFVQHTHPGTWDLDGGTQQG